MAFSAVPSTHIASWSEDGTTISVPIASFPELTAAEADGTTGDIRKIMYAFCHKFNALYEAMAVADRPVKMTTFRSSSIAGDVITRSYTITFKLAASGVEVADE